MKALPLTAAAILGLLLGAAIFFFQIPPYQFLRSAFQGGEALWRQTGISLRQTMDPYSSNQWSRARYRELGVTQYEPDQALTGFTLFTAGNHHGATLVDMSGREVHQWALPYSTIWDESGPDHPAPDDVIYWRKAHLLPNGDLLAIYVANDRTPWGYGLVKVDSDSNLLWKYLGGIHHDLDLGPQGLILTLSHRIRLDPIPGVPQATPPLLEDRVALISPEGRLLEEIPILEAFRDSPYASYLELLPNNAEGDYLHANAIDFIGRPGRNLVLLSLKHIDTLAVMDLDRQQITWATKGRWRAQHDPDLLPNGHILLFDNLGHIGPGGRSRIVELDPRTGEEVWTYGETSNQFLESYLRSAQQRLANGNTLITESDPGRILEVTPSKEVVWEYVLPHRAGEQQQYTPIVSWAQRFAAEELNFPFNGGLESPSPND